jgi:hypothetical protein
MLAQAPLGVNASGSSGELKAPELHPATHMALLL